MTTTTTTTTTTHDDDNLLPVALHRMDVGLVPFAPPMTMEPWSAPQPSLAQQVADKGLGWGVSKVPLYSAVGIAWPGAWGIQRDDTMAPLGVVGSRYKPLQNADMGAALDLAFGHLPSSMRPRIESAGALGAGPGMGVGGRGVGARVFAQLALPAELSRLVQVRADKGSEVRAYLTLTNTHDGGGSALVGGSVVRIVCRNTFAMANAEIKRGAKAGVGLRLRHTTAVIGAYREEVSAFLHAVAVGFKSQGERMNGYAGKKMLADAVRAAAVAILVPDFVEAGGATMTKGQTARVDAITEMVEGRDGRFVPTGEVTAYSVLQAALAYEMHRRPARGELAEQSETRTWRVLAADSDTITRAFAVLDRV
jgi:hypothetical protein